MKQVTSLILLVILLLFCVSCGKVEYTFYTDGGSDGEYSFRASGYHDAGELDLDHMPSSITLEKSEIVSKRTVNVNGIEWSGTYTGSDQTGFKNSEKKKLQKFGVIDSYKTSSDADYERIEVYHETGKVKEYYCYDNYCICICCAVLSHSVMSDSLQSHGL